jgi:hypothetical protein
MAFEPQRAGRDRRVNTGLLPPFSFVAVPMEFAMMTAAERNGEFIADLAAERLALHKSEMMRICRPPAADQAGMLGDISDMIPVTHPTGFRYRQHALIDRVETFSPFRF